MDEQAPPACYVIPHTFADTHTTCPLPLLLPQCFLTIGEQYNDALARAEDEGWALPNSEDSHRSALTSLLTGAEPGDAGDVKEAYLPWKYLPGFWPLMWFSLVAVLHLLMILLQHWSVAFRCLVKFHPAKDPTKATHAMATPRPNAGNGKTLLVPVEPSPLGPAFEFHRRKYVYDQRSDQFVKVRCRVDRPLKFYRKWRGLPTEDAVEIARLMFGTNRFEMQMPKFVDLYKAQLLSPFTVFQVCFVDHRTARHSCNNSTTYGQSVVVVQQ